MSLTSLLMQPDMKLLMSNEFGDPPDASRGSIMQAKPQTRNYALVGTAFDYILRWYLQEWNKFKMESRQWIAEAAPTILETHLHDSEGAKKARQILYQSHQVVMAQAYQEWPIQAIRLAKLDGVYRSGKFNLSPIKRKDIEDLEMLMAVAVQIPQFRGVKHGALNPTFGVGSHLVGGADADFVIGNILVDIKTTKYHTLTASMWHQLIGYSILNLFNESYFEIEKIAIYFSRHGRLDVYPLPDITDKFIEQFAIKAMEIQYGSGPWEG